MRHLFMVAVLLGAVWATSGPLVAQQGYFNVTGADFLEKTELVFVGKLVQKQSFWSQDRGMIFTSHVFQIQDVIKGTPQSPVEIIEYGGTVGDQTVTASHQPRYLLDQEYLVFSYIDLLKHNRTLAGPLGQFPVVRDKEDRRVIRIYTSHPLLEVLDRPDAKLFQELSTFSQRVRQAVEGLSIEKK